MAKMSPEQAFEFLSTGIRTGHLATTKADGQAHSKPIWFIVDGTPDDFVIYLTTWHESVAGRNLARDPRLALSVDDPQPPFSFVVLQGTAELLDDPGLLREQATRIAARYMGEDQAAAYGERNGVAGEHLVRITPKRLLGEAGVAD